MPNIISAAQNIGIKEEYGELEICSHEAMFWITRVPAGEQDHHAYVACHGGDSAQVYGGGDDGASCVDDHVHSADVGEKGIEDFVITSMQAQPFHA